MSKYICVICKPGQLPELCEIDASLEGMQKAVGGYLELFYATESGLDFFCNEEGKLRRLQRTFVMAYTHAPAFDVICGEVAIVGVDGDDFCDCPLDLSDWKALLKMWGN